MSAARKRIGDLLLESGVITEEQLKLALEKQRNTKMRLGDTLITMEFITQQQFIEALEFQLGIPHVQLYRYKIDPKIVALISQKLADQHCVIPLRIEGNKLVLAMADPLDYFAIDEIRIATGLRIEPVIASKNELVNAINRYYGLQDTIEQITQNLQLRDLDEDTAIKDEDSPVVKTVNGIITQAVQLGASDIHLDPQDSGFRVRYRVDGVIRTERTLPPGMHAIMAARIKIMANMNVAERRLPQDGRVELEVDRRKIDIRVATLPTIHGEKVVIRILDLGHSLADIKKLAFSERNERVFRSCIESAHGVVLITGPTGSGKSTTLYSALAHLNRDDVNIITVEDPVEFQLEGVNQVQVNVNSGLTFARGLRSILRQDPNIIMLGEIRDSETAEIAVRAAMTGHLVLSTLHTNSAVSSISRLIDMGVEPFLISSSVNCIIAQRLLRRICTECSSSYEPNDEEVTILKSNGFGAERLHRGTGCANCGRTGYKGRIAVHEVLNLDSKLRSLVMAKASDHEYDAHAMKQGMIPIMHDAINKAISGFTTLSEVFRVLGQGDDQH
ncbi:Flp pilus assembly complex ATPase component TadA [Paenibacillus sp. GSMTC-2017]|uniref:GspE/PulE family protein n=1 Tax=Paenibacillus sp. GSMTC-2017 TaxID=2794350 RepID=UPI0018D614A9|nr:ATPase, T2SS/T4P/T4SS family [Paenibacillus sp. GSMTC-2017]MBH5318234.1 Flp pilus assembly complex ATPase component TadA [Paenibacillus sp. GSMTC-2017]